MKFERVSSLLLPLALVAAGCEQSLGGRPCPCEDADGYSCWAPENRCIQGVQTHSVAGDWYTYSDRTVPNSLSPILYLSDAGFVNPMEGPVQASNDGAPFIDGMVRPYYRLDAGGETVWGVGFGLDLTTSSPPGDFFPVNSCDAGHVWNSDMAPVAFDASPWTGIAFYAQSFGPEPVKVDVHIDDDRTSPWGQVPYDAGGCNACANTSDEPNACSDSFSASIKAPPGQWAPFEVPFTSLHSGNYRSNLDASAVIHANKIYNLHFQISTNSGIPVPPSSLGVAYVVLYKY